MSATELYTETVLRSAGIEDTGKAVRLLRELAGQGVTDDDLAPLFPLLTEALRGSPDPDRALHSFARWFHSVGNPYSHLQTLLRHPLALELFCLVTGSSQYFADLLARHPEYMEIIANPGVRGGAKSATSLYRELSALTDACVRPELKRDALRRWKAREMLRIGVRDLLGLADMPATALEFSNLADACVQKALDIAMATLGVDPEAPPVPFAVIGMGKLGGQELNYSSDIDLMFVHGDHLPAQVPLQGGRSLETSLYLSRLAETLIKTLAEETASGHVFRVDMRLRPEGRFGSLTRSLSGYRAYYESWAENWERQALLKARFVAGDRTLGDEYLRLAHAFAFPSHVSARLIEDLRANKRRIERQCALAGETETNIKTGYGGIRDIEFIVQRLQLQFGGKRPPLRVTNTLAAILRLQHARLLTEEEARHLSADYQFLRTLEHRLQLLNGFQTQTLPVDPAARQKLARRMGFVDLAVFERELAERRERTHAYLLRLFYEEAPTADTGSGTVPPGWEELNDLLDNLDTPQAQERLGKMLHAAGFQDIPAAIRALRMPMGGNEFGGMPPDTPEEFRAIAPRLLDLLAHSPDPDAGLAGVESIALAVPNRAQLYAAFDDSPEFMRRLVLLAAGSPPLIRWLARRLEWMDTLFVEEEEADALFALPSRSSEETFEAGVNRIARTYLREIVRIGAREIWRESDVQDTMRALSRLADVTLQALLELCIGQIAATADDPAWARQVLGEVAIVGLGKLGGEELSYSSDWDAVFVYRDPPGAPKDDRADGLRKALVEKIMAAISGMKPQEVPIELDLRLRPWGSKGALIQSLHSFIGYYRDAAEMWERQAALKARPVAGNVRVGHRCVRILQAVSACRGITPQEEKAVVAMKQRIENERLKPSERDTDLKLGYGGLIDVEWLVQYLQLKHGHMRAEIRHPNTLRALNALATARLLSHAEVDTLTNTYLLLSRVRNAIWLQTGKSEALFPADPRRRRVLARQLGYTDTAEASAEEHLRADLQSAMQETRRLFLHHFYRET
ncbi:MAG: bifunctional [glutamate--ammonia ligase]-adenylyl-L-tyrosine phosphorylase/[glutamate--ammonia-ligase] adenylyltransferase [Chloroherpetonaceae bacterium]|nr:bifunctional [glutamate--ammonia ligase]-adenylyl-L-tyrosine phosphorylase/[glutamate--ammonia-ligase] adenylyltransferase [Chthonomonadaceae bacterium]MDW8208462.1 bifunctional [glutamate--ammonia ligase]-adenylyl-L-tyrosine phosphorylase/[glutamate--ammonia-ligase] adenylyltransferase [Chloroherpetonaceae bacterium]